MQGGPFNIHKPNQKVYLTTGIYGIRVLGGWSVRVRDFSVSLRIENMNITIEPKKTIWRVQDWGFKKRTKKIMVLDVLQSGNYIITFKNPKSLSVRRSNLIVMRLFEKELPNESLEICIG
ncbi:hypothetical protein KORDIASMS9_01457 [Kordia sp. SMS9]|uniref:hypothetical protein n=1 Tax=Kordia sp. SMS9 TaxID=2282170 RepID=UPI000E0CFC8B|nr:hypothetical protein [Kordia sp. SMS9]AXG69237.1 hypothetical protein KORDIASMS9_01457 [Kordia sp. SMS9]